MRFMSFLGALCLASMIGDSVARADWMFRRSYSSHLPVSVAPESDEVQSRAAYRLAIPQRGSGFQIRGAQRFNVYRLNSGQSTDTTIYRDFYFEAGSEP